jgi:hypothetical protein
LQLVFTCDCVAVIAGGCVMVNEFVTAHPAGLEMVQV